MKPIKDKKYVSVGKLIEEGRIFFSILGPNLNSHFIRFAHETRIEETIPEI
jgi:hypothetical protein